MSFNMNLGPVISNNLLINSDLLPFDEKLNVAHINCQSMRPSTSSTKFDELKSLIHGSRFDVFGISETWLKSEVSNRAVDIPGFKFIRNDRKNSRGGGVGIYVSNKLDFKIIFKTSVLGKCESLFIELYSGNSKVLFGVVYLPPPGDLECFEELHYNILLQYTNIVIVGDFNCNMFNVMKASVVRSMCVRLNMSVLHNSMPTHYDVSHGTSSLIDIMLVSDITMKCHSSQVQCPSISYHSLIYSSFDICVNSLERFIEYRDYGNIDWNGVELFLNTFDSSVIFSSVDVNVKCDNVLSLVDELHSFVPVVRRKAFYHGDEWMNCNKILFSQSLRDLAYISYKTNRTMEHWQIYCKYRNKAKSVIRRIKRKNSIRRFCDLNPVRLWSLLRESGCMGDVDMLFDGDVDVVNNFFAHSVPSNHNADVDIDSFFDDENVFSFACVDVEDVANALEKIKSKSVGVDGVSGKFLKLIFPYISDLIVHLINSVLTTSIFPTAWKTARVVPIPKTTVVNSPDDLRPISILPVLSKVLEHILKDQISSFAQEKISDNQYAYRRHHSTTSLLLHLTDSVRHNMNECKQCVLVSLDLTKAFNSVCYVSMINKLKEIFNFSRTACKLVMSYLCDRSQFVELNGKRSTVMSLSSGVPQGSVLGPLLFILYVNDICECINSDFCKAYLFADDVLLLFSEDRRISSDLETNINTCLNNILHWSVDNSLQINPTKTRALMFGNCNDVLNVSVGHNLVEFVEHHKCLGIIIDRKLSFTQHINIVHHRIYGILRRLYSVSIYLPHCIKKRLSHALLMPQILYGIEVISGINSFNFLRLKRVMNTITRFVYNIKRQEHISEHVKLFLGLSFNNFVELKNIVFFYKVVSCGKPSLLCNCFSFSHSIRNPQIIIPRIFNSVFERSFLVRIARFWNQLPIELRVFSQSNNAFRLKLFNYLSLSY